MHGCAKTAFLAMTALLATVAVARGQAAGEPPPPPSATEDEQRSIFSPRIGASLGNVAIYTKAGGTARIGKNLRDDFGPPRPRPALPGSEAFIGDGSLGWYLFAGVDGYAVARNIFLVGSTDGQSLRVTKRPLVREGQFGLALTYRGVRLTFTQVMRTPEFYEQGRFDMFGSINATFRY
jgi:lipid A 3-O-deacylase